jgi:ubiquinone/menaquinone biosynthesis C-methylase UbiE
VFGELQLKEGDVFLDVGCGAGDYAMHAARLVGPTGKVCAMDVSPDNVAGLRERAAAEGLGNVTVRVADATQGLPVQDGSVDVCLVATVLHIPQVTAAADGLFREIRRVLKADAHVSIIECGTEDLSFGPPAEMRLPPADVEAMAARCGFRQVGEVDFGFNYMIRFSRAEQEP